MKAILIVVGLFLASFTQASEVIPGEYIIKWKKNSNFNELSQVVTSFDSDTQVELLSKNLSLALVKSDRLTFEGLESLIDQEIEYIEPNYIYKASAIPNDPMYARLWGLFNMGMSKAWDTVTGNKKIVVAVIDTGVDYKHPDLADNIWINQAEKNGKPGVDDDKNGFVDDIHGYDFANNDADPFDDQGHGTHVSGTIGALGNNNLGVVGVNWNVSIMGLKFLTRSGSGSTVGAIKSIEYATQMGAHLMNASWGGGGYSQALKDAISAAGKTNQLFVAAAGNNGRNTDFAPVYPASYTNDNILSVCAITSAGKRASFSNYGLISVDVCAPGQGVLSTVPDGGYKSFNGTSMASPHAAGLAALLLSANPKLKHDELKKVIMKTVKISKDLKNASKSSGTIHANSALEFLGFF